MALWIAGGVSLDIWGACREQCQMPPCCRMSTHWTVGRLNDVRGSGDSSIHHLWLSSISQSSVVSAFSSVKLTAAHRKMIFKAIGWAARQEALGLWLQHHQNHYGVIARGLEYIHYSFPFYHRKFLAFLNFFFFQKKNYYNFKLFCQ